MSTRITSHRREAGPHLHLQGRPFAWQEAQIALVTVLQRFDLVMDNPSYELEVKQTLTIKPDNFYIHAIPRKNKPRLLAVPSSTLTPAGPAAAHGSSATVTITADASNLQQMYILYGSNTGSSKSFAERLAADAPTYGRSRLATSISAAQAHADPIDFPQVSARRSAHSTPSPRTSPLGGPSPSSRRRSRAYPQTTRVTL